MLQAKLAQVKKKLLISEMHQNLRKRKRRGGGGGGGIDDIKYYKLIED